MAISSEFKDRNVIPNWRDFKRTIQLGELNGLSKNKTRNNHFDISRALFDWQNNKNIGTAADLINVSFVSGISELPEIKEARTFIINNKDKSSESLNKLTDLIGAEKNDEKATRQNIILEFESSNIDEYKYLIDNEHFFLKINKTRKKTRDELFNPVSWIELARLYSMRGQKNKAEKAVLAALQLAPDNRFVLRSATRFFVHTGNPDKALFFLKKSDGTKIDPWLLSAHIATSGSIGRFSPFIKNGNSILDSKNFSHFDITELASSMGTLEFKDGSFKKARHLFEQAMSSPNDNSLAQLEWVSRQDTRFAINPFAYKNVINPFEAYAIDYFMKGDWEKSLNNCIKWFADTPFSKRPISLASYISSALLFDNQLAIEIVEIGLKANPLDPGLLNNMVYNLAITDTLNESNKYLSQFKGISLPSLPREHRIMIQATYGLCLIRMGDKETGKEIYEIALKNAEKFDKEYLMPQVLINFCRELILLKETAENPFIKRLLDLKIDDKFKDVIEVRDNVLKLLRQSNSL